MTSMVRCLIPDCKVMSLTIDRRTLLKCGVAGLCTGAAFGQAPPGAQSVQTERSPPTDFQISSPSAVHFAQRSRRL
jgi:hypothetical protein